MHVDEPSTGAVERRATVAYGVHIDEPKQATERRATVAYGVHIDEPSTGKGKAVERRATVV